jgi:nucleoside diphosphate kinase
MFAFFQAPEEQLSQHYHELRRKPFYPSLLHYMTSGPIVVMVRVPASVLPHNPNFNCSVSGLNSVRSSEVKRD